MTLWEKSFLFAPSNSAGQHCVPLIETTIVYSRTTRIGCRSTLRIRYAMSTHYRRQSRAACATRLTISIDRESRASFAVCLKVHNSKAERVGTQNEIVVAFAGDTSTFA